MTAFAVVLPRDQGGTAGMDVSPVAGSLAAVYSTPVTTAVLGGCVLMMAPLRDHCPGPFTDTVSGIAVAGQVLLEGSSSLCRQLQQPDGTHALALVAAAYARWGPDCTTRLCGEFGFALWDSRRRLLLAARDGLGIRINYVAESSCLIVATNIIAAALAAPGMSTDVDDEAIVEFLTDGALQDGRTPFRAVRSVPAGHTCCWQIPAASLHRHWQFPQRHPSVRKRPGRELMEEYRDVLEHAVADRLEKRAVSILLSGGIDSTTIAAATRHVAPAADLRAFTAVYHRLPSRTEFAYAAAAAERLGVPITTVSGDSFEALDHLAAGEPPLATLLDEPTLSDWRVLLGTAAQHSPVALYGEDGDSLFLPPGWLGLRQESSIPTILNDVFWFSAREHRLPYLGIRLRERLGLTPNRTLGTPTFLSSKARRAFEQRSAPALFGRLPVPLPPHPTRPRTQSRLCAGAGLYLAPLISPEVIRRAVELRLPLLDTRVVRFVLNTPAIPWCQRKYLPRCAYRGDLPDALLDRPKQGVLGLHTALLAGWRRKRHPADILDSPALEWIDGDRWRRALDGEDVFDVGLAWRVLQLQDWLERRHELLAMGGGRRCTA